MSEKGFFYIICWAKNKYRHTSHYSGSTNDLDRRIDEHKAGRSNSLVKRATVNGAKLILYPFKQLWQARDVEKKIKRNKNNTQYCPLCKGSRAIKRKYEVKEF
jgi:predicted GIY-YIG superfamily endonuclease